MQAARSIRWIRRQVADGLIGDPVQIHGEFSYPLLANGGDPNQWRIDPDLSGGAALMDIGIYPINTARYVLDADPVAARGTTHNPDPAFEGVDEHVAAQLEFPDAVTARVPRVSAHRLRVDSLSRAPRPDRRRIRLRRRRRLPPDD